MPNTEKNDCHYITANIILGKIFNGKMNLFFFFLFEKNLHIIAPDFWEQIFEFLNDLLTSIYNRFFERELEDLCMSQ